MEKILMALLNQSSYSRSFAEYISQKSNPAIDIRIFTTAENIDNYLREHIVDVLLTEEDMLCGVESRDRVNKVIILTEGECVRENQGYPVIFKYQSVDKIIKEVFACIAEDDDFRDIHIKYNNQTEFVGVFSPYGGSEVSRYSERLSRQIGRVKKVLLINLELLDSNGVDSYMRGMSEVVFYLKQKHDKVAFKLQSVIDKSSGTDCIYPVEDYRDLYSISIDDIKLLLRVLAEEMEYETVVFDVGYLAETSLMLMQSCDKLLFPLIENKSQKCRHVAFESLLVRENMADMINNISYVDMRE